MAQSLFVRLGLQSRDYVKGMKDAGKRTEQFKKQTTALGTAFKAVRSQVVALAGAYGFMQLSRAIVMTGANFERSMTIVSGVMRATAEEAEKLTESARLMGETTEWSATQSANALKFLGMAGFRAAEAMGALPGVLDLATAANLDLGRAADIATNALTAFGFKVKELPRINDVFIATITRTNTNMEEMAEAFTYAAPLAKAYGYEVEQLSAMIGILASAGVKGSMAGTQLAVGFQKSEKAAKELGIEGAQLIEVLKKINEESWSNAKIMQVFGLRSGRAALILKDLIPAIEKLTKELENAEGESKKLADTMRADVKGGFQELWSVVESFGIDIYAVFRDDIKGGTEVATESIRVFKGGVLLAFEAINASVQTFKMAFIGWDLILNPWVNLVLEAFRKIKAGYDKIKHIFIRPADMGKQVRLPIDPKDIPKGPTPAISKSYWEAEVKEFIRQWAIGIRDLRRLPILNWEEEVARFRQTISDADLISSKGLFDWDDAIQEFRKGLETKVNWEEIGRRIAEGTRMVEAIGGAYSPESAGSEFLKILADKIGGFWGGIIQVIRLAFEGIIADFIDAIPDMVFAIIKGIGKNMPKMVKDIVPPLFEAILEGIPYIIKGFIASIPVVIEAFISSTPRIINAIIEHIPKIHKVIIDCIVALLKWIATEVPRLIALWWGDMIDGVTTWWETMKAGVAGWREWMTEGVGGWWEEMRGGITEWWETIKAGVAGWWEWMKAGIDGWWEEIKKGATDIWDWITGTTRDVWDWITTPIKSIWDFILIPVINLADFISGVGGGDQGFMPDWIPGLGRLHEGGAIPRRAHTGMLAQDEVPAILQTGERVLSRQQNAAFERGAGRDIHIHLEMDGREVSHVVFDSLEFDEENITKLRRAI